MNNKELKITGASQHSLVAYYGNKPLKLKRLIKELQQLLKETFSTTFIPYDLEQVHATIIGCEGIVTKSGIVSKWFYQLRNEIKYLDYDGLIDYFLNTNLLPLKIHFAGYQLKKDYQFYSNNKHPYYRSFQIKKYQENTFIPIIIGWSLKQQIITTEIDRIRRDLQQFNYLHKYHKFPQDIDNDLYLRLGTIKYNNASEYIITAFQDRVVQYLENKSPTTIYLGKENLAIANYKDLSLPLATTKIYPLTYYKDNTQTFN